MLIFDYEDGDFAHIVSDSMAMDFDGNLMMKLTDNMAMDMDSGDIRMVSTWRSADEEDWSIGNLSEDCKMKRFSVCGIF